MILALGTLILSLLWIFVPVVLFETKDESCKKKIFNIICIGLLVVLFIGIAACLALKFGMIDTLSTQC